MKKLHFFLFRRPDTKPNAVNKKAQPPSVQASKSSSDDDSTNQSVVSLLDNSNNGWFFHRIIHPGRIMNRNSKSPKNNASLTSSIGTRVSSSPTTTTSSTKKVKSAAGTVIHHGTPLSLIRIDPKSMDESSKHELLQKLTSTKLMEKHGLDREDSIISYFKQVDDAYNEMVIVIDNNHNQANTNYNYDDNDYNEELCSDQYAIDQSISLITMDPALVYRHSITNMDEYSWKSFQSLSENDDEYYNDENNNEPVVAPVRYCHI